MNKCQKCHCKCHCDGDLHAHHYDGDLCACEGCKCKRTYTYEKDHATDMSFENEVKQNNERRECPWITNLQLFNNFIMYINALCSSHTKPSIESWSKNLITPKPKPKINNDWKLMTMLVGILLALAGWSLSRTFELSTIQAVHEDKVHKLERK